MPIGKRFSVKQRDALEANYGTSFVHASRSAGPLGKRLAVWRAARDVYEEGDTADTLKAKILAQVQPKGAGVGAFDWAKLLEQLIPILLALFKMFMGV